ncbi:MAG: response regulator [Gammaproteobacteria bacterium]|nr:response regulator [Gammaproteobacteria bacterium]
MPLPLLIVEDEVKIAELLRDYCEQAGYETVMIHDGNEALAWLEQHEPRMVLLDLMLPGADGYTICQQIRRRYDVPIIMITARVEEIDRLLGLELGADDYVCKPFSPREVIARVKAILRRVETTPIQLSKIRLDESSFRVIFGERTIELTTVEFNLFKTLFNSPGRIYSRDHLMSLIYADDRIVTDRTIDSHIKKIRKKLQQLGFDEDPIHSVYGAGYRYE